MLRIVISIHSALVMIISLAIVIASVGFGIMMMINGETQDLRSAGLILLLCGPIFAVAIWGNVAIMIDNNRLLRRIAGEDTKKDRPNGSHSVTARREPAISSGANL